MGRWLVLLVSECSDTRCVLLFDAASELVGDFIATRILSAALMFAFAVAGLRLLLFATGLLSVCPGKSEEGNWNCFRD